MTIRFLICTVGSTQCEATLRFGAQLAKILSAGATLLGIVAKGQTGEQLRHTLDRTARDLADCGLPVRVRLSTNDAEKTVKTELGRYAYDLVAVGPLGGQRACHSLLDLVAMHIAECSVGSVLVVKGNRSQLSRILICSSGTKYSRPPVQTDAAIARAAGAQITLLHVTEPMPIMYKGLTRMEETMTEFLQTDTEQARELKWAIQLFKAESRVANVILRQGIVANEILHEGREGDYDLIVLGSSRIPSRLIRVLLGDVARDVVSRAQRPVLAMHPPDQNSNETLCYA
jgi:nucleotide-binding universal stress UspA family protein